MLLLLFSVWPCSGIERNKWCGQPRHAPAAVTAPDPHFGAAPNIQAYTKYINVLNGLRLQKKAVGVGKETLLDLGLADLL